jgi:argininosuccinate lyase
LDATTLMEGLVEAGMPLRAAHEVVGKLVRECEQRHCRLADLPDDVLASLLPQRRDAVTFLRSRLGVRRALAAFRSHASTAPAEVQNQLRFWKQHLNM